jgi:hypothetical protein
MPIEQDDDVHLLEDKHEADNEGIRGSQKRIRVCFVNARTRYFAPTKYHIELVSDMAESSMSVMQ